MKNHESTLENHENQAKIVTNKNIKKHCQRLWSPKNRISSDGNMCPKKIGITKLWKKDHRHCIATKIWWSFKSSRDQDVDDDNNTQSSFSLMSGESDIADGVRPFHHPHVWTSNCCDRSHSSLQGYYNLHPYHSFSSSRLLSPSSCQSWSRPAPGHIWSRSLSPWSCQLLYNTGRAKYYHHHVKADHGQGEADEHTRNLLKSSLSTYTTEAPRDAVSNNDHSNDHVK